MNKLTLFLLFITSFSASAQTLDSKTPQFDTNEPFQIKGDRLFEKATIFSLENFNKKYKYYYRINRDEAAGENDFKVYKKPIKIAETSEIEVFVKDKKLNSPISTVKFYKKPNLWTVEKMSSTISAIAPQNSIALIDGIRGSEENTKNNWLEFDTPTFEAIIDRRVTEELTSLSCTFLQNHQQGIILPTKVDFYLSNNRNTYIKVGTIDHAIDLKDKTIMKKDFNLDILPTTARFIKIVAYNYGKLPQKHASKKVTSTLMIDEINSK